MRSRTITNHIKRRAAIFRAMVGSALLLVGSSNVIHAQKACTVIDTDLALDDYRAITLILGWRNKVYFVVSEGVTDIPTSSSVLKAFLVKAGVDKNTGVLIGRPVYPLGFAENPQLQKQRWITNVRAHFRAIANEDTFKSAAATFQGQEYYANTDDDAGHSGAEAEFAAQLRSACTSIEVLLIGPPTNFVHYRSFLDKNIDRVVIEMSMEAGAPRSDSFNCYYDWVSCMRLGFGKIGPKLEFADVPFRSNYAPTHELILGFGHDGIGGALVNLHQVETSWCDGSTLLWDDSTALYQLNLAAFHDDGDGLNVPEVDAEQFRKSEESAFRSGKYPAFTAPVSAPEPRVCTPQVSP
jgi:hypothetical protein